MGNLIINEWLKLTKKLGTWIMLALLLGLTIFLCILGGAITSRQVGANQTFASLASMLSVLNLIVVIVAATIISEEFSRGTIKFLLIRPYSRTQVYAAKFLTTLLFGLLSTVLLLITCLAAANLFMKAESPLLPVAGFGDWSALKVALVTAGVNLLLLSFYIAITMFISAILRSQAMSVGLGIGLLFGGSLFNDLLFLGQTKFPWLKWNFFNATNIKETIPQLASQPLDQWLTLDFWQSLGLLGLYGGLLYFFGNWIFSARDVALT